MNGALFGIPDGAPRLQTKFADPSENPQEIIADAGYDGLDKVRISAVSSTYAGRVITTVASGKTKTMNCSGKVMNGNVIINGHTL